MEALLLRKARAGWDGVLLTSCGFQTHVRIFFPVSMAAPEQKGGDAKSLAAFIKTARVDRAGSFIRDGGTVP